MSVWGCPGWDGFGYLFFGDCESGSGAFLGAQGNSGVSWVGCVLVACWVRGVFWGVRGLAGMGV